MYFLKALNKNLTVLCFDSMLQIIHRIPRINSQLAGPLIYSFDNSPKCIHTSAVVMKKRLKEIKEMQKQIEYVSPRKRKPVIEVWEGMTIEELGKSMGKDADHVFQLMEFVDNTISYKKPTDVLDWAVLTDIIEKARLRMKHRTGPKFEDEDPDRDLYPYPPASEDKLVKRPPIVTIMGHVDHGKTTLLDYLRKSSVVDSEFGGITQHIGAFSVTIESGSVTFLDTPGHAAFKAMRSRGAQCTDIVVLVVAADDGVMEQTEESIRMARNANVPIIVAINKIDKHNADIERTKKMLAIQDLVSEDMGGNVQCVPISALKGTNIDELVEAILVQAEISNLRSDPDGFVEGVVLESRLDPHFGKLGTALVRRGTMRKGTVIVAGQAWGRVRFMLNDQQKRVDDAPPSTPVEVSGWKDIPSPGDLILEVKSEKHAREVAEYRAKMAAKKKALEEDLPLIEAKQKEHQVEYKKQLLEKRKLGMRKLRRTGPTPKQFVESYTGPSLNIIIKADVEGSLEALLDVIETYHSSLCKLDIVHFDVGAVSKSDVELAELFNAVIYNFNVGLLPEVSDLAEKKNISIRPQNIIYRFLEDVRSEVNSRLPEKEMEEITGEAVVLKMFTITDGKVKNIPVAGCRCVKGDLKKNSLYRVLRNDVEIFRGMLHSMRNLKTEVTSIKKEQECGLRFQESSYVPEPGDVIQSFRNYTVPQEIDWDPFGSIR